MAALAMKDRLRRAWNWLTVNEAYSPVAVTPEVVTLTQAKCNFCHSLAVIHYNVSKNGWSETGQTCQAHMHLAFA